jgi:hypothetical protein
MSVDVAQQLDEISCGDDRERSGSLHMSAERVVMMASTGMRR